MNTKKYISYLRVSTDKQGVSGLGLEAQKEAIKIYTDNNDGIILSEFVEVESGKRSNNRPELLNAIKECKKHKAVLIIAKLDRLARNVHFISGLLESGIEFIACDNPHANKMMIQLLSVFAEFEREQISTRTKQALAQAKARGVELGKNGKALALINKQNAHEFAREIKPIIDEIIAEGITSLYAISNELNSRNVKSYSGTKWHPQSVKNVLKYNSLR